MYQEEEIVIDLKDVCCRLLLKWRLIFCVGIIAAVLGVGIGAFLNFNDYQSDLKHAEAQKIALSGGETDYFDKYLEKMTEQELEQFVNIMEQYKEYEREYGRNLEYFEKSLYMNMDPDAVLNHQIQYHIDLGREMTSEADYSVVSNIASQYASHIIHTIDYAKVNELTGLNLEIEYWKELISIGCSGAFLNVNITAPTEATDAALCQVVDEAIINYMSDLREYGKFSISIAEESCYTQRNESVANIQKSILAELNGYEEKISNLAKPLNETQKLLFEDLTEDLLIKLDLLSMKSAVIGGLLGGIVICGYILLQYIMGSSLRTDTEISTSYGMELLGSGYIPAKKKAFLPGIDKWIVKVFVGESVLQSVEDAQRRAEADIRIMMKQNGWKQLYLATTTEDAECMDLVQKLRSALASDFSVQSAVKVPERPAALVQISSADCVVLAERVDVSSRKAISKTAALCERYKTPVLGAVIVREV